MMAPKIKLPMLHLPKPNNLAPTYLSFNTPKIEEKEEPYAQACLLPKEIKSLWLMPMEPPHSLKSIKYGVNFRKSLKETSILWPWLSAQEDTCKKMEKYKGNFTGNSSVQFSSSLLHFC